MAEKGKIESMDQIRPIWIQSILEEDDKSCPSLQLQV